MFCHLVSNILLGATMQSARKNTRNNSLTNLVNFLMKLTLIPPLQGFQMDHIEFECFELNMKFNLDLPHCFLFVPNYIDLYLKSW